MLNRVLYINYIALAIDSFSALAIDPFWVYNLESEGISTNEKGGTPGRGEPRGPVSEGRWEPSLCNSHLEPPASW